MARVNRCPVCGKEFSFAEYGGRFQASAQYRSHLLADHGSYTRFMRIWTGLAAVPAVGIISAISMFPRFFVVGVIVTGVSVALIPLVVWLRSGRISAYRRQWTERLAAQPSVQPAIMPSEPGAGDEGILQAARSLSQLLNIPPVDPVRIQWIDYMVAPRGGSIRVEADKPIVGGKTMTLPLRFKDRLTADEWRPLIATMLITRAWQRKRIVWSLLLVVAVALALYFFVYFFFPLPPMVQPLTILVSVLASVLIVGFGFGPLLKKEILAADRQVAGTPGISGLLQVLQKLDASGDEKTIPRMSPFRKPSVSKRLENLQTPSI